MKRQKYGLKADIWSIGIILYEMIYGKLPYDPMKSTEMYDQIMKKNIFPNEGKVNGVKPSP
jgi:serine/threonine-protein kinase ULK/ATG1